MRRITMFFAVIIFITLNLNNFTGQAQWSQGSGMDGGDIRCLAKAGTAIYAGSQYGGIFRSLNNGDNWVPLSNGLPASVSVAHIMENNTLLFAGTGYWSLNGQGVFRSDDGGATWIQKINGIEVGPTPSYSDYNTTGLAKTISYIYTSMSHNGVYRSANNGDDWLRVFDPYSVDSNFRVINALCTIDEIVIAGGTTGLQEGGIFRSLDHGATWNMFGAGFPSGCVIYQLISGNGDVYARTSHGFYWSPTNGEYWVAINSGITDPLGAISGAISVDGDTLFTSTKGMSENPKIYKSINGGMLWVEMPVPNNYVLALLSSGANVFAGHLGNYGLTSDGGGVVRSLDGGATWAQASVGISAISGVALTSNGTDVFAGTHYYSGIFKSTTNGGNWTKSLLPGTTSNQSILSMLATGTFVFAGVNTNGVYKSADGGINWTTTASIAKPIYALGANATYLFAGTSNDGMRRSSNNGTSWTTINTGLPTVGEKSIRAISVSGSKIYIGNSRGVFVSSNDGTNWTAINGGTGNPGYTSIKALAVKGDTIFGGTGGGILRSTNHGTTWAFLPTAFGFGTSIILSGTKLYAGGPSGVAMSADWGETWNTMNTGFPSIPEVYSLHIANGVLYAGTYGQSVWQYSLSQAPAAFTVNGGGSVCVGGSGLPVGLSNSELGVTYTLYKDNVAQTPTVAGTGSAISFGNQTAGTFTVSGTNASGTTPMTGSAVITEIPAVVVSVSILADINPVPAGSTVSLTATPVNGGQTPAYQSKVNGTPAGTDNPVFTYMPVNQDAVTCTLTSSETCTTGNPATSNEVVVAVIPDTVSLQNIVVTNGETKCYDALQTIFVAGEGVTFTVEAGGSATMIAGHNIIYYPGTTVEFGGYMHGYISTVFCTNPANPVVSSPAYTGDFLTSVSEKAANRHVIIYPNPAVNAITIELTGNEHDGFTRVGVFNMNGLKVIDQEFNNERKQVLPVGDLHPGMYFIQVTTGKSIESLKLIKR